MSELVLHMTTDYGAPELKKNYQTYFSKGLAIAVVFHLALVGSYWASVYFHTEEPPVRVIKVMKYSELGPPPSISGSAAVAPAVSVAGPVAKPSVGIPVPVPDAEVNPEQTFATQQELSATVSPVGEGAGTGSGGAVIEQDVKIEEDDAPPPAFVPFEKEPTIVKRVEPVYPELAQKAGLEGKVIAYLWIDKQGKVRDVKVIKSDSEVFNQPVIDAAKQWIFTPALMKNGPVAVWLSVPFNFTLK
jgi:protein TonB